MINRPIIEKRDPNLPVQPATATVLDGLSFNSLFPIIGQSGSVPVFTQPNFPSKEKQSTNKMDKNVPKSRIVFNKDNFPTIYQAFNLQKTKKIKKKKRNNRLIKRFEIELINIPQKILQLHFTRTGYKNKSKDIRGWKEEKMVVLEPELKR